MKLQKSALFWDDRQKCRAESLIIRNKKTAGYHRLTSRPPILLKLPSKRLKAFFTGKYSFFIKFRNFSKYKVFLIFSKHTSQLSGKDILRKNIIRYAIYGKFSTFTNFEKSFFCRKNNFDDKNFESQNRLDRRFCQDNW